MTTFTQSIIERNDQQLDLDSMIALVCENAGRAWSDQATNKVHTLCLNRSSFDLDDVASAVEGIEPKPHDNRAIAQVMRNAKKDGWCIQSGVTTSKRQSRHKGYIATYNSLLHI